VAERFKALVLKTSDGKLSVSSNLTASATSAVPVLETSRLLLRPHAIGDTDGYLRLWTQPSPSGQDFPGAPPLSEEVAWARLLRWIGHWTTFGFGPFVVTDRASGALVGEVGFGLFHRGLGIVDDRVPEAMWRIDHAHHGQGIATEAMRAVLGWFDVRPESTRTVCMIDPPNTASRQLAASLGFREFAQVAYRGNPVVLLERVRA
jgi:RimJ/RimL family protein N-acetyltransferase